MTLDANSKHTIEVQADVHSTAFLRWVFKTVGDKSQIQLRVTYSEGYELEPRSYPFFRSKADRLDATVGQIVGPYDEVTLHLTRRQGKGGAHKNPVLTPHFVTVPLIINGVQKLNMVAMPFDRASARPAVWARRRCCGTSAA